MVELGLEPEQAVSRAHVLKCYSILSQTELLLFLSCVERCCMRQAGMGGCHSNGRPCSRSELKLKWLCHLSGLMMFKAYWEIQISVIQDHPYINILWHSPWDSEMFNKCLLNLRLDRANMIILFSLATLWFSKPLGSPDSLYCYTMLP